MTTDDSPDIRPGDEAAAAEQHTLSDREQAAWNAEQELASAWAAEARARASYRARMEDTAQAIANARASKLSWQTIADEMGIHLTNAIRRLRTRDNPADGHPVSEPGPDLNEALAHEHRARRHIDQAMDNTAAAIALTRQTGATWATISTTLGGLARRALVEHRGSLQRRAPGCACCRGQRPHPGTAGRRPTGRGARGGARHRACRHHRRGQRATDPRPPGSASIDDTRCRRRRRGRLHRPHGGVAPQPAPT